jgi:hypothetical protein
MGRHPVVKFVKGTGHAQDTDAAQAQATASALMAGQEKHALSARQKFTICLASRNAPQSRIVQGTADVHHPLIVLAFGSGMEHGVQHAPWDFTVDPVIHHAPLSDFAQVTDDAPSQENAFVFMDGE